MKRFYKLFACWVSVLLLVFSPGIQSLASFESLLISTDSNALMTMELDDSDYSVMPMSSIGTVSNTIEDSELTLMIVMKDSSNNNVYASSHAYKGSDGRYHFSFQTPEGMRVYYWTVMLYSNQIPSPGTYFLSCDFTSDFAFDDGYFYLYWERVYKNADTITGTLYPQYDFVSGDIFLPSYKLNVNHVTTLRLVTQPANNGVRNIGGSFSINFTKTDSDTSAPTIGSVTSNTDYQSDVSSSLSDLSSSVESVEEEISLVTQAIQTLQGAMEPHYDNVLTQLHHITEQLHAFYDQVYNNIHLPELDMLTQIRTAIENIDLQIEVDISEVKTAINNMSTAIQNKLQATTDQITGGFDNSQQTQQNQQLQDSINAYDEVEEDIFEDVDGFMQEFEYPSFDSMNGSVIKALAFIGGFLQSIFLSMGDFGTIITFSLTMIFVMIIVGYHRIRS